MARYKDYNYDQAKPLPISFSRQILPGTFEYSLNHLIDHELDLSVFDARYRNDETGAPAYDPAILLKIAIIDGSDSIDSRLIPVNAHGLQPGNLCKEASRGAQKRSPWRHHLAMGIHSVQTKH